MPPAGRPANRFFASGREFSLIESLFDPGHFSRDAQGLGDDAYLMRPAGPDGPAWAVTTDASVEGIHYRLDWCSPAKALEKALLSNLSDINAMGGRASLAFFALGALKVWDEDVIATLREVLAAWERKAGFRVAGGDTVRKESESFFTFTVLGPVAGKPLLRGNARPGHGIYVSGTLGGSAAGLDLFLAGLRPGPEAASRGLQPLIDAHLAPRPPLDLGPFLASLRGPVAAIDLSDGLSSELGHLARQSGCRMAVEMGKLPYIPELEAAAGSRPERVRDWVLHGGEEYQLLFTGEFTPAELEAMVAHASVTRIGTVEAGEGVVLRETSGAWTALEPGGWSH
jgi:thiamine-monophosphate kinase